MFKLPTLARKPNASAAPAAPQQPGAATANAMPEQVARNLKTHSDAMIQYGARLLVMREMLVALSAHMPPQRRAEVEKAFRQRIDDLLSLTDDRMLTADFHSTLLSEVNYYLNEIKA
jgi:hypothetical protein